MQIFEKLNHTLFYIEENEKLSKEIIKYCETKNLNKVFDLLDNWLRLHDLVHDLEKNVLIKMNPNYNLPPMLIDLLHEIEIKLHKISSYALCIHDHLLNLQKELGENSLEISRIKKQLNGYNLNSVK